MWLGARYMYETRIAGAGGRLRLVRAGVQAYWGVQRYSSLGLSRWKTISGWRA